MCVQIGLAGAQCTSYTDCSDYYPCDSATSKCKALPAVGESCSTSTRCFADDAYCDTVNYMCKQAKPDGTSCTSPIECVSGECNGVCGPTTTATCP
jgi:hypothetical protein